MQHGDYKHCLPYHPCDNGLHICGFFENNNTIQPKTMLNVPFSDPQRLFEVAKEQCEAPRDEETGNYIVDLMINGDICADFETNRQMFEVIERIAGELL